MPSPPRFGDPPTYDQSAKRAAWQRHLSLQVLYPLSLCIGLSGFGALMAPTITATLRHNADLDVLKAAFAALVALEQPEFYLEGYTLGLEKLASDDESMRAFCKSLSGVTFDEAGGSSPASPLVRWAASSIPRLVALLTTHGSRARLCIDVISLLASMTASFEDCKRAVVAAGGVPLVTAALAGYAAADAPDSSCCLAVLGNLVTPAAASEQARAAIAAFPNDVAPLLMNVMTLHGHFRKIARQFAQLVTGLYAGSAACGAAFLGAGAAPRLAAVLRKHSVEDAEGTVSIVRAALTALREHASGVDSAAIAAALG